MASPEHRGKGGVNMMKRTTAPKREGKTKSDKAAKGGFAEAKNPLVISFAARLLKWRQDEGLTLKAVASDLDLSIAIICEWEHAHRFPSIDNLLAVSRYTGIPVWEFLKDPEEKQTKRRAR